MIVFSTAREAQAGRISLVKDTFPEFRNRCRAHDVELVEALRWGASGQSPRVGAPEPRHERNHRAQQRKGVMDREKGTRLTRSLQEALRRARPRTGA